MWMSQLIEFCDPEAIQWVFVSAYDSDHASDVMVEAIGSRCPIIPLEQVSQTCDECDIVIIWGNTLDEVIPPGPKRFKVVLASLGMCDFTRRVMQSARDADAVVAVSQVSLNVVPSDQRHKAVVIPTAVDPRRIVPERTIAEVRESWNLTDNQKALVYIGRVAPEKNPLAVARTVAGLHRMGFTEWRGIVVGPETPPKYAQVMPFTDDTPCLSEEIAPGLVRFMGLSGDIGGVYAAADHMILPSFIEGGSLSLLEMWAAGRPVLATPVGMVAHEHPDLVRQIPVRAMGREMAQALVADLEDPQGTRNRVERARKTATEQYSVEKLGQRWTKYLRELASHP
jgi:glycosyltransferase involved in cell wall biosynthesis